MLELSSPDKKEGEEMPISAQIGAAIAALTLFITRFKRIMAIVGAKWSKLAPVLMPLVIEAEQMMLNGVITKEKRKQFVVGAINLAEQKGIIKLNWWERWILPLAIDKIASAMPDIDVSKQMRELIAELKKG